MEDKINKVVHQERIEYLIDDMGGEPVFVGRSVNYKCCCQGKTLEDLKHKMSVMIGMWLKFGEETMALPDPLDMKEITREKWDEEYKEWEVTSKWIRIADALYDYLQQILPFEGRGGAGVAMKAIIENGEKYMREYESLTTRTDGRYKAHKK